MTRRAFTLIELLVVISIIALLVAILLPALSSARQAAETVTCQSNVKQVTLGAIMYADSYGDYLPIWTFNPSYLIYHTPPIQRLADFGAVPAINPSNPYSGGNIRFCPTLAVNRPAKESNIPGDQSITHYLMPIDLTGYTNNGVTSTRHKRIADVPRQSSTYLHTESFYFEALNMAGTAALQDSTFRHRAGANTNNPTQTGTFSYNTVTDFRHTRSQVNFSFVDGHGETRAWNESTSSFGPIHYVDNLP